MLMTQVILCHRHRLLTECLASVLPRIGDYECRVIDPEGEIDLISRLESLPPADVFLLDPLYSSVQSTAVAQRFRSHFPRSRLALLISLVAADRMVEFAQMQCDGYILDEVSLGELQTAIESIVSGRQFCSPQLANALLAHLGRIDPRQGIFQYVDDVRLTAREREILQLIGERLSNKQIARRLHVSLFTVKNHVHNIIEKFHVEDRYEALEFAQRRKWLLTAPPVQV
jgi:DNA-binding NarL/FixJ family response regulator